MKAFACVENGKATYYSVPDNAILGLDKDFKRVITANGKVINPTTISEEQAKLLGCPSVKAKEIKGVEYIAFLRRHILSEPQIHVSNCFDF